MKLDSLFLLFFSVQNFSAPLQFFLWREKVALIEKPDFVRLGLPAQKPQKSDRIYYFQSPEFEPSQVRRLDPDLVRPLCFSSLL